MSTISLVIPTLNVNIGIICQILVNFQGYKILTRLHFMLDIISYKKRAHEEWRMQLKIGMVKIR